MLLNNYCLKGKKEKTSGIEQKPVDYEQYIKQ